MTVKINDSLNAKALINGTGARALLEYKWLSRGRGREMKMELSQVPGQLIVKLIQLERVEPTNSC